MGEHLTEDDRTRHGSHPVFDQDGSNEDSKRRGPGLDRIDSATIAEMAGLACPFMKRNPEKKWPKSCLKPFAQVYRIKYDSRTTCS